MLIHFRNYTWSTSLPVYSKLDFIIHWWMLLTFKVNLYYFVNWIGQFPWLYIKWTLFFRRSAAWPMASSTRNLIRPVNVKRVAGAKSRLANLLRMAKQKLMELTKMHATLTSMMLRKNSSIFQTAWQTSEWRTPDSCTIHPMSRPSAKARSIPLQISANRSDKVHARMQRKNDGSRK